MASVPHPGPGVLIRARLARTVTLLVLALALLGQLPARPAPESVRLTTSAGGSLEARYVGVPSPAAGVVFFPMCRPDATDGWMPVAERLRAHGISSVTLIYRGYGDSRGGPAGNEGGDQRANDGDAALAWLRARIGPDARVGVAGSSCGVGMAMIAAGRHVDTVGAVVALTGPHTSGQLAHMRATPGLAVFSGSAEEDRPAPDWARELKAASANSASRLEIFAGREHGTDIFRANPQAADTIAAWLRTQLLRR